jgi:hypothetical protein
LRLHSEKFRFNILYSKKFFSQDTPVFSGNQIFRIGHFFVTIYSVKNEFLVAIYLPFPKLWKSF